MLPLAQAGASPAVAASKTITGYDPVSMQVVCMDTAPHEDCPPSEEEYLEDMIRIWRRKHSSKAPKGNDAPGQQQTAARSGHAPQGGVASKSSTHRSSKPQWRPKHTPHIGRDELIVVLKPNTTLDLKATFAAGQVGSAVRNLLRECGNVELSVWPVWEQNVIVCGLNSEPATRRLLGDVTLTIDGRQLPFRGHAKATGDVCKGDITIDPNDTSGSLKPKLRWKTAKFFPADICPRPKPGRCDQCGCELATTPEGPVEHKCTPRCLICGGEHLTGTSGCNGKYRKPIKPGTSPTTDKRKDDFKKIQASKGSHKTSTPVSGRPAPVKNNTRSGTVARTQIFSAEDFPTLPNAPNKVSDWVRAASRPLCSPSLLTTPTEVALQRQNAEVRRQSEILANKIQELETRLAGLTESQTTAGTSEPMQQSEPSERDESASVASGVSSASRCSDCTFVQRVPHVEQRLTKLERTIEELPKKILEGVRASFAELWQQELSQIILAVTDSVMDTVQDWVGTQLRDNRSRSRSPRSDSHRQEKEKRKSLEGEDSQAQAARKLKARYIYSDDEDYDTSDRDDEEDNKAGGDASERRHSSSSSSSSLEDEEEAKPQLVAAKEEVSKIKEGKQGQSVHLGRSRTNKGLRLKHGKQERVFRAGVVSNQDFTDSDLYKWTEGMNLAGVAFPTTEEVARKLKDVQGALNYQYKESDVETIVSEKQRF
ncbi:hypothetical protein HPB48_013582 [Haemaphysalis longicornis]|uniref:Plus3 domain-containing protein n=1 Tax=Haemaphysalis longicornis TaxID=44386 RepID=A0A9J6H4H2_HAELO|nr:hypothetical protein HPB48_013582 [Haemaphysalis longicornis]